MWRLINCEFVTGGLIGSFWNKRSARGHRGNQVVEKASLISAEMCAAVVRRLPNVHFPPPSCSRFPQTDEETTDALTARKKRSRSVFFASKLYRGFRVTAGHAQARNGGVESNVGANAPSLQLVRAREARIQHYVVSPTWRKRRRRRRRRLDLYPLFRYTLRRPGGREETSGSGGAD